ncbi:MAG: branched-chain-amino-acid transaminase [Nitrososphaerales archaeon]|nr:branched-chain-amino-acid transaminase [Nitrososphaerales archaeon]
MSEEKKFLIYINGTFYKEDEAKISVFDHGLLYGDGIFEGIRVYDGRIFMLDEHLDRLYESAKTINLQIPLSKEEFRKAIIETARKNGVRDAYIRPIVTRGYGGLGLDPRNCKAPTVIIIVQSAPPMLTKGKAVRAIVSSIRKNPPFCLPPMVKSLNYLNNILAKIEAINAGVDEAIMLDWRGYISEGTATNIFIVKDRVLNTPPLYASILAGITRRVVIELAKELKIDVIERDITLHELYNADEAFLTGTGPEIQPIIEVDKRKIGTGEPGPITLKLTDAFRNKVQTSGVDIYS